MIKRPNHISYTSHSRRVSKNSALHQHHDDNFIEPWWTNNDLYIILLRNGKIDEPIIVCSDGKVVLVDEGIDIGVTILFLLLLDLFYAYLLIYILEKLIIFSLFFCFGLFNQ